MGAAAHRQGGGPSSAMEPVVGFWVVWDVPRGMGLELATGIPLASGGTGVALQQGSSGKGARGIPVKHRALRVGKGFRELGCGGNM